MLAAENKLSSSLVEPESVQKIQRITANTGIVYSGMGPDFRLIVRRAQKKAAAYKLTYGEDMPVAQITRAVARIVQEFTQSGGVRPFGVSLLIAGWDHLGAQLFQVDPSGAFFEWKASAIGSAHRNAKSFLEKRYADDMELEDAIHVGLLTLREGVEGEMTGENVELAVADAEGFRILGGEEVADYLEETT